MPSKGPDMDISLSKITGSPCFSGTSWKDFNFDAGRLTLAAANYVRNLVKGCGTDGFKAVATNRLGSISPY